MLFKVVNNILFMIGLALVLGVVIGVLAGAYIADSVNCSSIYLLLILSCSSIYLLLILNIWFYGELRVGLFLGIGALAVGIILLWLSNWIEKDEIRKKQLAEQGKKQEIEQ